ncbi:MAG: hypothetical protein GY953_38175, partial [bacterium]|nr:hypothetical protein [bacterium]
LDRSQVAIPAQDQPSGNAGRNIVRSPAFYQLDLGLHKNFDITEAISLQFRAEAFNTFNRTNFRAPDAEITSQGFGQINSTFDPREIQFGLKLLF